MSRWRRASPPGLHLVAQQFEVHHDGVDGVLDLVADSRGETADGGHAPRDLELGFDFADGFQIVEGEQRAERMAVARLGIMNEVERDFDAAAGFGGHFFLHDGHAPLEGIADERPRRVLRSKISRTSAPKMRSRPMFRKRSHGAGNQDGAGVPGEQHDAVLQIGEDLVEVLAQGGEDLFDVANALAEALDFAGDLSHGIVSAPRRPAPEGRPAGNSGSMVRRRLGDAVFSASSSWAAQSVEPTADLLNGLQSEVGHKGGNDRWR